MNGKSVGCAAGLPFQKKTVPKCESILDDTSDALSISQNSRDNGEDHIFARSSSSLSESSVSNHSSSPSTPVNNTRDGVISVSERIVMNNEAPEDYSQTKVASNRERRTQLCFLIFGILTLLCVPLCIIYCYNPLVQSVADTDEYVSEAKVIVREAEDAVSVISLASAKTVQVLGNMSFDFNTICPGITSEELQVTVGVELDDLIDLYVANYTFLSTEVSRNVSQVQDFLDYAESVLHSAENMLQTTEQHLWVIPTVLVVSVVLTVLALAGVFLAWKREFNNNLQKFFSYGMLPLMALLSLTCWAMAIGGVVASAVSVDACLSGSQSGSPEDTIESILVSYDMGSSTPLYRFVNAYATNCTSFEDPSNFIEELEGKLSNVTDFIWRGLTKVDAAGQENIEAQCQGKDNLEIFLNGTRVVAEYLTDVQRAIINVSSTLSCARVNHVYDEAVNQSICSTSASSVAFGFIFFLLMGVFTMVMISLRASWQLQQDDVKIYEESEVAENMIVDEHEEYLAYISKYKHEWEEYQGLSDPIATETVIRPLATEHSSSSESIVQEKNAQENVKVESLEQHSMDYSDIIMMESNESVFDPYSCSDSQSQATAVSADNISFLSLRVESPKSEGKGRIPTSLLLFPVPSTQLEDESDFVDGIPPPNIVAEENIDSTSPRKLIIRTRSKMTSLTSPKEDSSVVDSHTRNCEEDVKVRSTTGAVGKKPHASRDVEKLLKELEDIGSPVSVSSSPKRISNLFSMVYRDDGR
jgi:hypothetical protein